MATSSIEWTDSTWNPVAGCTIVSPGCSNCYAMRMAARLQAMGMDKYKGVTRRSGNRAVWTGKIKIDEQALIAPLGWKKPQRIFVNSMSDLFHESVPDIFIGRVWGVMNATPHHVYQILTKRPDRMAALVSKLARKPLPNVWLGTSVESGDFLYRLDALRKTKAVIRFVSFEPLLGPIIDPDLHNIDWAIVGGESGPKARPMQKAWVENIRRQCRIDGTAFFFKQWGGWGADGQRRAKKKNGRQLNGKTWDQMPDAMAAE